MGNTVTGAPAWLNVKEVAAELRVSQSAVYRAVQEGRLPSFRLSQRGPIRIPRDAVTQKEQP